MGNSFKATMVEFLNDDNAWGWYKVSISFDPKTAIINYLNEHSLNEKQKIDEINGEFYAKEDDVRAYKIEIT